MTQTQHHPLPWTTWRVSGADANTFLDGQLTARTSTLAAGALRLAGYCSPKGRLLALFWAARDDQGLTLSLPTLGADSALQRLRMYVLRSDVQFTPVDEPVFGITHAAADTPFCLGEDSGLALTWRAPADAAADDTAWRAACIARGLATIDARTADAVIPQMIGLEQLGGLEFKKGCYPGQEIVARLHFKGTLPRRMFRAAVEGAAQPGDDVLSNDQAVGIVIDAVDDAALVIAPPKLAGSALQIRDGGSVTLAEAAVYPDAR